MAIVKMRGRLLGSGNSYRLEITNDGVSDAVDVTLQARGDDGSDATHYLSAPPVAILSGQRVELEVSQELAAPEHLNIELRWRYRTGGTGVWRTRVPT